ncbi:methyltransferase domain-containing protein [Vallitalea okinawensis]|uniref:methyltransferase domain-containing protein n=1 Tax=Vallitalea okinawensis TaxID=2078660 RepID=UPI000CFB6C42|nr:class I SAM-dependent methyltransferase [Vallitalea okinawensis]
MYSFYSQLSTEVYDLDKPIGKSFGDIEFYATRLANCDGPILEPAVGTGRILIPLLNKGFNLEGMDCSSDMLSLCRSHCEERGLTPQLYEANMQSFSLPNTYEAIIIPTGSFLLIQERNESINALKCFYNHLVPGGRIILDIFLQTDFHLGIVSTRNWTTPTGDLITLDEKLIEVNYIEQYTVSHMRYEKWRDKKLIESELEYFPLRWYGVEEFKTILENVGFKDIVVSSDYNYGQYPTTPSQTITFEAYR